LEKQKNILEEWIEKKAKYAKRQKIIDAIKRALYLLYLLQSSKKIEELHESGMSQSKIGKAFGVSNTLICKFMVRK